MKTALSILSEELVARLAIEHPGIKVLPPAPATLDYAWDAATAPRLTNPEEADRSAPASHRIGPAVAFPVTADEVSILVHAAAAAGVEVVPRGAGTGLAGGASAGPDQLVISTERMTRIVEVSPADELAVVEPGVINAELNRYLENYGLFYAPDPASWRISTIGGNVATNAGGLRCVKYGVTRESVLALDVVLADGSLVTLGQRSIKGVAGLDLRSLVIGSEGTLGIVVSITVRLHPIPVARQTLSAWFPDTLTGAASLTAVTESGVRPSIAEFIDGPTLADIDTASGSELRRRGGSLLLLEIDGYGIEEQYTDLAAALADAGARVDRESPEDAEVLWELRRSGRSGFSPQEWIRGGDIAVPRSRLADIFAHLPLLERKYGITASALAHAGDGNVHPRLSLRIPEGADPSTPDPRLEEAERDLTRLAVRLGGTVTAEHGIGTKRRDYLAEEQSARVLELTKAIKDAADPAGTLNPRTAF